MKFCPSVTEAYLGVLKNMGTRAFVSGKQGNEGLK